MSAKNKHDPRTCENSVPCFDCEAVDILNADHPARQAAIKIIEQVIEPLLYPFIKRGIEGEPYYVLEDKITLIIAGK